MDVESLCNSKYFENINFLWRLIIEFHQISFYTIKFKVKEGVQPSGLYKHSPKDTGIGGIGMAHLGLHKVKL